MKEEKEFIFDDVRRKWVRLTPEEWVRQNMLQYLLIVKKYPKTIIAVEKEIKIGSLKKRCDIVVYKNHVPWMIIECKETNVPLREAALNQTLAYNLGLHAAIFCNYERALCAGFSHT